MAFALHPQLLADTHPVVTLNLCEVLLLDDARYPWLVLVPRLHDVTELTQLDITAQSELMRELNAAMKWVQYQRCTTKLNVGALGNLVPQLHVHVIGRHSGDPAWPGPAWGHSEAVPYEAAARQTTIASAQHFLESSEHG